MPRRKLGEILIKAGVVDAKDVTAALREQLRWGGPLGRILIDMKLITEDVLVKALSKQLEVASVNLDREEIPDRMVEMIPPEIAERHMLIAFGTSGDTLHVAMSDPTRKDVIEELAAHTRMRIQPFIAGPKALERAVARYYSRGAGMLDLTLGKAGAALLDTAETGDELADASGFIVPDEAKQKDTAEQRQLRDSQVRAKVVPGPQPLPGSGALKPSQAPSALNPSPTPSAPQRPPSAPPSSSPVPTPLAQTPSGKFRTGLSAAAQASSGEIPTVQTPPSQGIDDLRDMLRTLREELAATQRRVATLESLLNRDEDVLRKLLSLLIEKRIATREEILERIK